MTSSHEWILPAQTLPPATPIERRHAPVGKYETFRDCWRWDFGFTCALCLVHERDLRAGGVERLALMWAEHPELKSAGGSRDDYSNLVQSCRLCNTSRGRQPDIEAGVALLDPSTTSWAEHFELVEHELRPRPGDERALRTWDVYQLDDVMKTEMRRFRRERVDQAWRVLRVERTTVDRLQSLLDRVQKSDHRDEIERRIREADGVIALALATLRDFAAIPSDAPSSCVCERLGARALPEFIAAQCQRLV